jgi:hypothetical protein
VLSARPYWTKRQLLDVAEELSVPLFNHKRLGGWRTINPGVRITRVSEPDDSLE